jgi:hypothetical protein
MDSQKEKKTWFCNYSDRSDIRSAMGAARLVVSTDYDGLGESHLALIVLFALLLQEPVLGFVWNTNNLAGGSARRGGLPATGVDPENVFREVTLDRGEFKPVNVLRSSGRRDTAEFLDGSEGVRVPLLRILGEIELGANARTGEWVGDEVVLAKLGGTGSAGCFCLGGAEPGFTDQARNIEKVGYSADGSESAVGASVVLHTNSKADGEDSCVSWSGNNSLVGGQWEGRLSDRAPDETGRGSESRSDGKERGGNECEKHRACGAIGK